MRVKNVAAVTVLTLLVAACNGHAVLVETRTEDGQLVSAIEEGTTDSGSVLARKGEEGVDVGEPGAVGSGEAGAVGTASAGDANCATTSNPDQGFTADTLKIGTILPVTGALRPLGEQTARVMKLAIENINRTENIPGPLGHLNWGCPTRQGVYGRKLVLRIFSLQANTPEEALAGMRRLIDVENVFLVRDCYLQTSLMGPATQYQNQKGVPAVWCHFSEMPYPELAPWNYAPGTDPQVASAIHAGYIFKQLERERVGILADPTSESTTVRVVRAVAEHFDHPIPDDCVIYKRAQEASNGMRSEIAQLRTCYGGRAPDAVIALDALNGVFGAMEAESQGWKGSTNDVVWSCTGTSCWVTSLAELCGDSCEGMYTDCQALPCVPFADPDKYPAVQSLEDARKRNYPQEPQDILTYGPAAITGGLALWLTMTGPELSREAFRNTLATKIRNWSAGIGPILNITSSDHFGGKAAWLIQFTGQRPYFEDSSGRFLTLDEVGVPYSLVTDG